jgi:DNA-binding transcriptional LysR family regulator
LEHVPNSLETDPMTLEQLRIFVAVGERGHMTRAAEALHLSQSAVSSAVAALETRHAVRLFDRVGRGLELSAAGRAFLPEAKAVLARAEAAERALQDLAGLARGSIAIHASQTIASYWLPERLVRFKTAHPNIETHLSVGNTAQVARAVREGVADLGFVEGPVDDPALRLSAVGLDRLVVVSGAGHPFAQAEALEPQRLAEARWILREPGSGTRSELEDGLRRLGVDPFTLDVALELPSNEAVAAAVAAGGGLSALSELAAAPGLASGALRRLPVELPERPFQALVHREREGGPAVKALLQACR